MRWIVPVGGLVCLAALTATASLLIRAPSARASSGRAPASAGVSPATSKNVGPATERACQDNDHDGYGIGCEAGNDCNDSDAQIHPGQAETANLRDDDCDALVDEGLGRALPEYNPNPVRVAASVLLMGSPPGQGAADEHPLHRVDVSAFSIDRYEVTNARYAACLKAGTCERPALASSAKRESYFYAPEFANYPVVFVSWEQAEAFCRWDHGRLPTEAEWELAARGPAPSQRVFPWGDEPADCSKANMGGPTGCLGDTDLVGRRTAGASFWGAMDMAGNVWEWTADWYDPGYYTSSPDRDPQGPSRGTLKVMRGGCWASGSDSLRVSCRKAELPGTWAPNVGFRCVRPEGG
jgi:formylglycine-generating enzyme required for sulfatase activity